jgi:hypothetical protein
MRMRPGLRALALTAVVGAAGIAGCRASGEWVYDKPKVTTAQLDRDLAQCRQQALPTGALAFPALTGPDRAALNVCMQKRGYSVTRP